MTQTMTVVSTPVGGQTLKGGLEFSDNGGANATCADNSGIKTVTAAHTLMVYIQTPVFTYGGTMYIPSSYTVVGATNNTDNASGSFVGQGSQPFLSLNVTPVTAIRQNLTVTIIWVSLGAIPTFGYESMTGQKCPICGSSSWHTDNLAASGDFIICDVCGYQDTGRELTES